MQFKFVSREAYRQKNEPEFLKPLAEEFGRFYLVPEGGNNAAGALGCKEILPQACDYDYVFCACGTGTTYAGLYASKSPEQILIGISVLKGENKLPAEISRFVQTYLCPDKVRIAGNDALQKEVLDENCILSFYAFKGYARLDEILITFKDQFEERYNIPLDHVYTTKLFYGVFDLIALNKLRRNAKVLVIHSGGLQGNKGFEDRYHLKPKR